MQDEQRPDEEWLTVEQVASELALGSAAVTRMLREGRLGGRKIDPASEKSPWRVARRELDRYRASMQAQARLKARQERLARAQTAGMVLGYDFDDSLRQEARDATQERIASSLERIAVALERATPSLTLDHIVPRTWEANHHGC